MIAADLHSGVEQLGDMIAAASSIVPFTGAGISTESTFLVLGGAFAYRVPPDGWRPPGWQPSRAASKALVTDNHVHLDVAWRTPQFWLLWSAPRPNVTAGIGILGMASPLLQEVFGGHLIGVVASFDQLSTAQKGQIAAIAEASPDCCRCSTSPVESSGPRCRTISGAS